MRRSCLLALVLLAVACDDDDGAPVSDAAAGADAPGPADAGPDATPGSLEAQLAAIEGLTFEEEPSPVPGYRFFRMTYDQPADHDNPGGQRFQQRLRLLHRDATAPLVLATTGYSLYFGDDYVTEPAALLAANQLFVEERYFADSRPEPPDWSKLDIRQAAADHHRLAVAFKTIYGGPWIATGASKGGMTSIYHARFHPADLAGVVAYVAPISFGAPDDRYIPFFDTVGTAGCRQKIHDFQRLVLQRRGAMEARTAQLAAQTGDTFAMAGIPAAVEGAAQGFEFSFWQYGDASFCSQIPDASATDAEVFGFIEQDIRASSDETTLFFQAYYVQAATELGYPALPDAHLVDLLTGVTFDGLPDGCCAPYSPTPMQDVAAWVGADGARLLLVYGQNDPWTAGQFTLGAAADSFLLIAPGQNHGAEIADLTTGDRTTALDALERWTGVTPAMKPAHLRVRRPALREPLVRRR